MQESRRITTAQSLNAFPPQPGAEFGMVAKTVQGLEEVLEKELIACGATQTRLESRAVSFRGDEEVLWKANLCCRTALRILIPWMRFRAQGPDELYTAAIQLPFKDIMGLEDGFAIDATVHSTHFSHSKYAALKFKDALADHFRKHTGKRPNVEVKEPDIRFNLFIREADVTVLIDSSGDSLHKRGYRGDGGLAPLNEVLAAGMLMLAGYNGTQNLVDPMCGSGTLLTEALLIASDQFPQCTRSYFSFRKWKGHDEEKFKALRRGLLALSHPPKKKIQGFDIDGLQLRFARMHLDELKYGDKVELDNADFFESEATEEEGLLIMNPPYGERIGIDEATAFYEQIGSRFKHAWPGWKAWLITSNLPALKRLGLKPSVKHILFNGPLECRFQAYELFKGSLKEKKSADS